MKAINAHHTVQKSSGISAEMAIISCRTELTNIKRPHLQVLLPADDAPFPRGLLLAPAVSHCGRSRSSRVDRYRPFVDGGGGSFSRVRMPTPAVVAM